MERLLGDLACAKMRVDQVLYISDLGRAEDWAAGGAVVSSSIGGGMRAASQ
jgi:hypothetical protein